MSGIVIGTLASWFEKLGGSSIKGSAEYTFRLRVLIAGHRVTPRHSMFEHFLDIGSGLIPKILRHEPLGWKNANLLFVLPERWMSVHEQRIFIQRLITHPESCNLTSVDIVTQEPLIVSAVSKKFLALFQISDDDPEKGLLDTDV